ncbi:MAG: hypothetical protein [Bacteriophage sp.]|nr:MAG: hypothetical protein [Bacteriophage sp.]
MKYEYLKGSEKDFEGAPEWATECVWNDKGSESFCYWLNPKIKTIFNPNWHSKPDCWNEEYGWRNYIKAERRQITEPVVKKCTDVRRGEIDSSELQSHAKKFLEYNKDTGTLTWIYNTHKRFIGKEAGCIKPSGYRTLHIFKTVIEAHRLIWLIEYGYLPDCEIDHINGNKSDNRLSNLRLADQQKNQQNRGVRVDSQLGVKGVRLKPSGKYEARVKLTDGSRASKTFKTVNEAVLWLAKLRIESHGEYAKTPEIPTVSELMRVTENAIREDCEAIVKMLSGK